MKKAMALCLTAAMAASLLTGCGSKTTETTAAAENKTETTAGAAAEEKKDEENAINTDLFQTAYTVNSHKKKLTAVEGLVSGVVERVQK